MSVSLQYFKAVADETRIRLLNLLYHYELNVNELVSILAMGQSRISRHLKILTAANLLHWRRDGLWVFYSTPENGESRKFIDSIIPFIQFEESAEHDIRLAKLLIEERARKTQEFFNEIAEDWDKLAHDVLGKFSLPDTIAKAMPNCTVSCDLGCGTGNVLEIMLQKAQNVIGVDGSARMLEIAKKRFSSSDTPVSLRIGDLSHLPLRDNEADFATLNLVLHHIPTPVEALLEVCRIIRPGGSIIVTDFARHADERMRNDYGDRWLGFTSEDLTAFLQRAGFTVVSKELVPVERGLSLHIFQALRPE